MAVTSDIIWCLARDHVFHISLTFFSFPAKWILNRSFQLGKHLLRGWFEERLKHECTWQSISFDASSSSSTTRRAGHAYKYGFVVVFEWYLQGRGRVTSKPPQPGLTTTWCLKERVGDAHVSKITTDGTCKVDMRGGSDIWDMMMRFRTRADSHQRCFLDCRRHLLDKRGIGSHRFYVVPTSVLHTKCVSSPY